MTAILSKPTTAIVRQAAQRLVALLASDAAGLSLPSQGRDMQLAREAADIGMLWGNFPGSAALSYLVFEDECSNDRQYPGPRPAAAGIFS